MPSIITDTFDYNDIIRVLDQDEAFVHHQVDDLQPKYFRIYYCPLNMFLCRIIRFLAKDKPPLKR